MFMGRGAGDMPTASAIVSDLLRASSTPVHRYPTFITDPANADGLQKNDDWRCAFYVRTMAIDWDGRRAILMVDFRTSSPATLSSMTMTRVAPDTGAHCVTMMP